MSIPEVGKGTALLNDLLETKKEERPIASDRDTSLQKVMLAVTKAIKFSSELRAKSTPSRIVNKILLLENSLKPLGDYAYKLCKLYDDSDRLAMPSSDEEVENAEKIQEALGRATEELEKEMQGLIKQLVEQHKDLGVAKDYFSDWWTLNRIEANKREISLAFMGCVA